MVPLKWNCLEQGFLNYGLRPQMGSLSEILGSRDFDDLQDGVAVFQDGVINGMSC